LYQRRIEMLPEEIEKQHLEIDEVLLQIGQGEIPVKLIVQRLVELIVKLDAKERQLEGLIDSIPMLSDITKKISEIHTLHFPAKHLKKKSQKERFMAEILLGSVRKRK
jgi:DNA-binding ferritin-like protein (Dps family)